MARVIVTGAGVVGLGSAMLLARDGHEVTVLERDAQPPPAPIDAWDVWERQGINQFRLLHFFLPRFRAIAETELPDLAKALDEGGALRYNPVALMPDEVRGEWREDDTRFESITARRPVMEAILAAAAAETAGVTIRRGVAVQGLMHRDISGVPHVVGVRAASGEDIPADLVVDAAGRRSPLPAWLEGIGARRPAEEIDDSGFVYYGRHFRGEALPPMIGPLLQEYGSVSVLTLPADHATWGIGVITSSKDAALRGLRDADRWTATVKSLTLAAHWLDGEPLEDRPIVMAKIEDRRRQFVVDGEPVATGVLAVGDAWACTNPSVGRGASIGLLHAVALRDLLRTTDDDPRAQALEWDARTAEIVGPHYEGTLAFDRSRLAEMEAIIDGRDAPTDDQAEMTKALQHAATQDPSCIRAFLDIASVLKTSDQVFGDADLFSKVIELGAGWREAPPLGPTRQELVRLAAG
jgi:2-polyprenyl-6-methoxyphenol hydroxylase-like FAD-dependent oxidoreductase